MKIVETSTVGAAVLQSRTQTIVLGVSINNSYFKEGNLEQLLLWAPQYAGRVYVMIPDEPMISTFMELGYSEKDAIKKSRLKANNLEAKCRRVIIKHTLFINVVRWRDINRVEYTKALSAITALYELDTSFQNDIYRATESVIHSNGVVNPSGQQIDIGVNFLLKELAFITYADQILVKEKVAYIYNKTTEVLRYIIDGKYMFKASPNIGYATVK